MKPYSILLVVLWAVTTFTDIWSLAYAPHILFAIKSVGTPVLFTLCMAGCVQLAWDRRLVRFSAGQWRTTYQATLAMGGFYVVLKNFGDVLGVPTFAGDAGLLQLGLDFLPYLLFAVPVILLKHELKKSQI